MKVISSFLLLFIFFTSCATQSGTTEIAKSDMIAKWGVEYLNGVSNPSTNLSMTLNLEENTVQGFAGCNNFSGNAEREGNNIKFPLLLSTQMACELSDMEQAYLGALSKVRKFSIDKNILTFYGKGGKELIRLVKMSR